MKKIYLLGDIPAESILIWAWHMLKLKETRKPIDLTKKRLKLIQTSSTLYDMGNTLTDIGKNDESECRL